MASHQDCDPKSPLFHLAIPRVGFARKRLQRQGSVVKPCLQDQGSEGVSFTGFIPEYVGIIWGTERSRFPISGVHCGSVGESGLSRCPLICMQCYGVLGFMV